MRFQIKIALRPFNGPEDTNRFSEYETNLSGGSRPDHPIANDVRKAYHAATYERDERGFDAH